MQRKERMCALGLTSSVGPCCTSIGNSLFGAAIRILPPCFVTRTSSFAYLFLSSIYVFLNVQCPLMVPMCSITPRDITKSKELSLNGREVASAQNRELGSAPSIAQCLEFEGTSTP